MALLTGSSPRRIPLLKPYVEALPRVKPKSRKHQEQYRTGIFDAQLAGHSGNMIPRPNMSILGTDHFHEKNVVQARARRNMRRMTFPTLRLGIHPARDVGSHPCP